MEIVLQRGPREQKSVAAVELSDLSRQSAVLVLDAVRLINDDILPRELAQGRSFDDDNLVRCHHDMILPRHKFLFD